jgi:predicted metalloprotease with PDZ domain
MSKKRIALHLLFIFFVLFSTTVFSQHDYKYFIDLNKVHNDLLQVELQVPKLTEKKLTFEFAKIIPGTYAISDYGKFVSDVKAFDKKGKALPVKKISEDKWRITNNGLISKVSYTLSDIFDTKIKHNIMPMAATNFEAGKDFVINTPGYFGFFDRHNRLPFTLTISKPASLYASTSLSPISSTTTQDIFKTADLDALYDSPILYTVPDTTSVTVGNCKVLVSVYSPEKKLHSQEIAQWMSAVLNAASRYLGGKLPTDKYAFLYYFNDIKEKSSFPVGVGGALEHTTSSFYYLPELPASALKSTIVDASTHEFFHIITPLTIASKEIKQFNYDTPILSKHLWLYEGVTEYTAHYVQEKYGLITVQQFLDKLSEKITNSRTQYNDTLPFTILSKQAAGKYAKEYGNVYEKGALIGACLDVYLLYLSKGKYGLRNLTHDLAMKYGKDKYFKDDELFDVIKSLTYPEIKTFLETYVAGTKPVPYDYFFGLAGVSFSAKSERKIFSIGGIAVRGDDVGHIVVGRQSRFNDFGRTLGYKVGDVLYAINRVKLTTSNYMQMIDSIKNAMKEGEDFVAEVGRKNAEGKTDTLSLATKVFKATYIDINKLAEIDNPTAEQKLVRDAWLATPADDTNSRVSVNSQKQRKP